jgi:hypothetical protein
MMRVGAFVDCLFTRSPGQATVTGGGSEYAAILAHAGGVLYGMELGSVTLKRIGFFCFPIKHSTHTRPGTRSVCVECLFLGSPSRAPCRTPPACAKRQAHPASPFVVLHPESIAAQAAYTEALLPGSASGPNCFQALGSSPGLLQSSIL